MYNCVYNQQPSPCTWCDPPTFFLCKRLFLFISLLPPSSHTCVVVPLSFSLLLLPCPMYVPVIARPSLIFLFMALGNEADRRLRCGSPDKISFSSHDDVEKKQSACWCTSPCYVYFPHRVLCRPERYDCRLRSLSFLGGDEKDARMIRISYPEKDKDTCGLYATPPNELVCT